MVEYVPEDWIVFDTEKCKPNPYAMGYGSKIPTRFIIVDVYEKRRRRNVYAICWSNVASFYCIIRGKKVFIQDSRFP